MPTSKHSKNSRGCHMSNARCLKSSGCTSILASSLSLSSLLFNQVKRIFRHPSMVNRLVRFSNNRNVKFSLVSKFGADGFSDVSQFRGLNVKQSNVFASSIVPVMVKATDTVTQKSSIVWTNPRANSFTAVSPLRQHTHHILAFLVFTHSLKLGMPLRRKLMRFRWQRVVV